MLTDVAYCKRLSIFMCRMQELMGANTYARTVKSICSFTNTVIPMIQKKGLRHRE